VAVQKAQDPMRAPLFGRAVHAVDVNESFLYMMVKGSVDLVVHAVNDNDPFLYMMVKGIVDFFAKLFRWAHN
jgi:hypothetical protein